MLYDIKYETFMFNLEHIKMEQYLNDNINAINYRRTIIGESNQILYEGVFQTIKTAIINFFKAICNFFKKIIDKLANSEKDSSTVEKNVEVVDKKVKEEKEFQPTTVILKNFCVNKKYPSMYDLFKNPLKNFITILFDEFDNFFEAAQKPKRNFVNYDETELKNAGYLTNFDDQEYFDSLVQTMKENGHKAPSVNINADISKESFINNFTKDIFVTFEYRIKSLSDLKEYIKLCKDLLKDTKNDLKSYKKNLNKDKKEIESYIDKLEKLRLDETRQMYFDDSARILVESAGKLSNYLQMSSSLTYVFLNMNLKTINDNILKLNKLL